MIYTVEIEYDYDPTTLLIATGSLKTAIKAMNAEISRNYFGDAIFIAEWSRGTLGKHYRIRDYKRGGKLLTMEELESSETWK